MGTRLRAMSPIALIDNYDSYTYNLFHLVARVTGTAPQVFRNDEVSADELLTAGYDAFVISPGPGRPDRATDLGVSAAVLESATVPCLGVCLGHQGLVHLSGGVVGHARTVMHGRISRIRHTGTGIFANLPQDFSAVRYHSLVAARPLPDCLEELASAEDGEIMAVRHLARPLFGVQFHPESIATDYGHQLLGNFFRLRSSVVKVSQRPTIGRSLATSDGVPTCFRVHNAPSPESIFTSLFADLPRSFWLDSSSHESGRGEFDLLGAAAPTAAYLTSRAATRTVEIRRGDRVEVRTARLLDCLDVPPPRASQLPIPFAGGYIGYVGYEEADGRQPVTPVEDQLGLDPSTTALTSSEAITAELMWVDRAVVVSRTDGTAHVVAMGSDDETLAWARATADAIRGLPKEAAPIEPSLHRVSRVSKDTTFDEYAEAFSRVQGWLKEGESYEACLTYQIEGETTGSPVETYRHLRRLSPAPYAAFLRMDGVTVVGASPEQFLAVDGDGVVSSKPIKGTAARLSDPSDDAAAAETLRSGEKTRSENLMIADLIRNDLGRVCQVGSVRVPKLMDVETYQTLHQLVTTVEGQLDAGRTAVDAMRALLPPGSMTGAPKIRTVELLQHLEPQPRGIYSGCLGFIGGDGRAELGVVIRTLVFRGGTFSIGVGGAITALSEDAAEYEETRTKAKPLLAALGL